MNLEHPPLITSGVLLTELEARLHPALRAFSSSPFDFRNSISRQAGHPFASLAVSNLYDRLDLVGVKDRADQWTRYGYNAVRQLKAITNVNGQVTLYMNGSVPHNRT